MELFIIIYMRFLIRVPEIDEKKSSDLKNESKQKFKKQFNEFWKKESVKPEAHGYKYISPTPLSSLQEDIERGLKKYPGDNTRKQSRHHKSVRSTDNPTLLHHIDQPFNHPQSSAKHVQELIPDSEAQPNHLAARVFHQALNNYFKQKNQQDLAPQQNYLASVAINKELGKYFTKKFKNDAVRAKNAIQNPHLVGQYYPRDDNANQKHETSFYFKEEQQPHVETEDQPQEKVNAQNEDEKVSQNQENTGHKSRDAEELFKLAEKLIRERDNKKQNPENDIHNKEPENTHNQEKETKEHNEETPTPESEDTENDTDENEPENAHNQEKETEKHNEETPIAETEDEEVIEKPASIQFEPLSFNFEFGNDIELPSFPGNLQKSTSDVDRHKQEIVQLLQEADDITSQKHESESKRNEELQEIENLFEGKTKIEKETPAEKEEIESKNKSKEEDTEDEVKTKAQEESDEVEEVKTDKDKELEDERYKQTEVKSNAQEEDDKDEQVESEEKLEDKEGKQSEVKTKTQEGDDPSRKYENEETVRNESEKVKLEQNNEEQPEEDQDQFYYEYFVEPSKETIKLEEKIREESGVYKNIAPESDSLIKEESFEEALQKNKPLESASLTIEGEENPGKEFIISASEDAKDEDLTKNNEEEGNEHQVEDEVDINNQRKETDEPEETGQEEQETERDDEQNENDESEETRRQQQENEEDEEKDKNEENHAIHVNNESHEKDEETNKKEYELDDSNDKEAQESQQKENEASNNAPKTISYNTNPDAEKTIDEFVKENFQIEKVDEEDDVDSLDKQDKKKEFDYGNFDFEYSYPFDDYWAKYVDDKLDKYENRLENEDEEDDKKSEENSQEEESDYVEENEENNEQNISKENNDEQTKAYDEKLENADNQDQNKEKNDNLKYPHESKTKEVYTQFRNKLTTESQPETNQKPEDTKNIEVIQQEVYSPTLGPSVHLDKFSSVPFDFDYSSSEHKVNVKQPPNENFSVSVNLSTSDLGGALKETSNNLEDQIKIQQSTAPINSSFTDNTFHSRFRRNIQENWTKAYKKPLVFSFQGRNEGSTNRASDFHQRLKREIEEGWYKPDSYDPSSIFYEIPESEHELDLKKLESKDYKEDTLSPAAIVFENQSGRKKAVIRIKQNETEFY